MRGVGLVKNANFTVSIVMGVLAFVAVVVRCAVRGRLGQQFTVADWLCGLSLCLFWVLIGVVLHYIVQGSPTGNFNLLRLSSVPEAKNYLKMLFITDLLFGLIITIIKLSILTFYHSLFSISRTFTRIVYVVSVACLIWFITVTFIIILQCHPVDAFWNALARPPKCQTPTKRLKTMLGYEITNLILDVTILALPVGMVRQMTLPYGKKVSVVCMFLLGGFACLASVNRIREIALQLMPHATINMHLIFVWSTVQLGLAIICCCLPTYGPVFAMARETLYTLRGLTSSRSSRRKPSSSGHASWPSQKLRSEEFEAPPVQQNDTRRFNFDYAVPNGDRRASDTRSFHLAALPPMPGRHNVIDAQVV